MMLTRQEMYDRAVRGLRGQDFRKATKALPADAGITSVCVYRAPNGDRCAWGHVDPTLSDEEGSVTYLNEQGRGVAAQLDEGDLTWANLLQACHDDSTGSEDMERRLREFGESRGLRWPS